MTYRRDSDIFYPYGTVVKMKTNYTLPDFKDINKRKHMVAWFSSNCNAERRNKYVKELSKYIEVHVYGTCGNYSCLRSNEDKCYQLLEDNYKFYLSFENSMCADYVTEKMFNILRFNVIPVVLGNSEYSEIAPPYSVINTNHFDSPKALADYLYELNINYDSYVKYFEWKKDYIIYGDLRAQYIKEQEHVLCQLCELLNRPLDYKSYSDIKEWFYVQCYI